MMKSIAAIYSLFTIFIFTILFTIPSPVWAKDPINKNWKGIAIKGYDPVAYFILGKPVKGKSEFEYKWKGAKWRFSDAEHLNLFSADPEKYAPQYVGY
jgi:YHS domain-containing protein